LNAKTKTNFAKKNKLTRKTKIFQQFGRKRIKKKFRLIETKILT